MDHDFTLLCEEVKVALFPESIHSFGDLTSWPIPEFAVSRFSTRIFEARTHLNIVARRKGGGGTGATQVPSAGKVWDTLKSLAFAEPVTLSHLIQLEHEPKEKNLVITASLSELAGDPFDKLSALPWFRGELRCVKITGEMMEWDFDWTLLRKLLTDFPDAIFYLPDCLTVTSSMDELPNLTLAQLVRVVFIFQSDLENPETYRRDWYNWLGEEYCRLISVVVDAHRAYYYYTLIRKRVKVLDNMKLKVERELREIEQLRTGMGLDLKTDDDVKSTVPDDAARSGEHT